MKVLVSGYYGFGNAGDEALLEGLLTGLKEAGHEPTVLSGDPPRTRSFHGVRAAHRVRGALPALLACDALVSGGGGLLQDRTSSRSLGYYLALLRTARLLGKRAIVYGQSIGPLSAAGRRAVGAALDGIPVAVRDASSRQLLSSLGVDSTVVGDPALLLEPTPGRRARGRLLLVPRQGQSELNSALAAVGRREKATGTDVAVLALHPAEDRAAACSLAAELGGVAVIEAGDHRVALQEIAAAEIVASVRLHGLILATVAARPWVGLVYDPKVAGFVSQAGGVAFEPPVDIELLAAAVAGRPSLPDDSRDRLVAEARTGLRWLDARIRERP